MFGSSERAFPVLQSELKRQLAALRRVWIGRDIVASDTQVLYPGEDNTVVAETPDGSLPPVERDLIQMIGVNGTVKMSVRSRLAQSGFDLGLNGVRMELNGTPRVVLKPVIHGDRPIRIVSGQGLGRFYSTEGARMILGRELFGHVTGSGRIGVSGDLGNEWSLAVLANQGITSELRYAGAAVGIAFRLSPTRFRIPGSDETIDVHDHPNYRNYLDQSVLSLVAGSDHAPFWVGETLSEIRIPPGIHGELNMAANAGRTWVTQTSSLLIEGGQTNWRVRSEFTIPREPASNVEMPGPDDYYNQHLIMHFFEDLDAPQAEQ